MRVIKWSIKDIVTILQTRQQNEFDGNIAVSGDRGNGKSTCINKIYYRFNKFRPQTHQVYSREDVMKLLRKQKYSLCFDDEAINTGYKRNFQNAGQQELIKILTNYRDNYNIHGSAIPNFFSLDKDLRDLYFLHLHVIERGIAIVHIPLSGRLYSQDRWDAKFNAKIEEQWSKKAQKNPKFKPPYHKLSTFRGYLFFSDLTEKQKALYKQIKEEKRKNEFQTDEEIAEKKEEGFMERLFNLMIEKKLTKSGLMQSCLVDGRKYSTVTGKLNSMLKNKGIKETVRDFLCPSEKSLLHNSVKAQLNQIIPDF
jgi:hypothetical protein